MSYASTSLAEEDADISFGEPIDPRDVIKDFDRSLVHPLSPPTCSSCNQPCAIKKCSGCKGIDYCAEACQSAD
ncbi:hypothetical protein BU23DRAFT_549811 [Bimuria novae-zelandiae CBS 107.79]|uniref:Suppressor of anucleate metulae protein B n=1 Tax=Bimuria novae-zelandiae CBS 107.79 TaxID=1447943 RepID=A0A6A5VZ00_9PLEO|nr:hypothetical protein BU23DRAFT_549811 [Bimuria novae-zelandiae CBS 107.79]